MERFDPTNNTLLIKFLLSSDAEIFVNNHRLSMQIVSKHAKKCMQRVDSPTEIPFCIPTLVVGNLHYTHTHTHTKTQIMSIFCTPCRNAKKRSSFFFLLPDSDKSLAVLTELPDCLFSNRWTKHQS